MRCHAVRYRPNWLNAKDETDRRRLDEPDDFIAIELAAALTRNILVIPVLVDGTSMHKASELPASLKPFALRNGIQLRNTILAAIPRNLLQKCTKRLLLGDPNTPKDLLLWFSTTMMASFLLSISVFLFALSTFFTQSENYAGALAATVAALLFSWVGARTLGWDEGVRMFGLVISIEGLLAVTAIIVSAQFFRIGLLDSPDIQNGSLGMSVYFLLSALTFGIDWKKITSVPIGSPNIWVTFLSRQHAVARGTVFPVDRVGRIGDPGYPPSVDGQ